METNVKTDEPTSRNDGTGTVYHVNPGMSGWSVKDSGKEGDSRVYPNKIAAVSAARRMLKNASEGRIVVHRKDGRIESEESTSYGFSHGGWFSAAHDPAATAAPFSEQLPVGRGNTGGSLIQEISAKTGESHEEIVRKALALYKAATEAIEQGKSVGIASDPGQLEAEFVGF